MSISSQRSSGLPPSVENVHQESKLSLERIQRLRVNRVAIVQALRVEHILNHLLSSSVLSEEDKVTILASRNGQDRARTLVDLLPQKFPGKTKDWYGQFREALRNPETRSKDVKAKYEMLIEFLDNTIIHLPSPKTPISKSDLKVSEKSFPRYDPLPGIHGGQEKGENESPEYKDKDLPFDEDSLQKPSNFGSLIQAPEDHFRSLVQSAGPEDLAQLDKEKVAFARIQHLETVFALDKRGLLPEEFDISQSKALHQILSDPTVNHYYFKYLTKLKIENSMAMIPDIAGTFCNYVAELGIAADDEIREKVTNTGFGLYRLLLEAGNTNKAEFLLLALMQYLSTCTKLENWMALYEGLVRMMSISNENVDYQQTDANYHMVIAMGRKIELMSFGLDLLDESTMFSEMSVMLREQGSIDPAYTWAQKALREVEPDNEDGIVEVMCTASLAYALKWEVKKAEQLTIEAIKRAKASFGTRHPLYVKALLHYVYYAIDFRQDDKMVEVARVAVSICEKIYRGYGTYQAALAHQALAKALMANKQYNSEEYFEEAMKAWRCALDSVEGNHPRLAQFRYTLAQALQCRAMQQEDTEREASLVWAETEAKAAAIMYKRRWGTFSIKVAQVAGLLAQIYAKMDKPFNAEEQMMASLHTYQLSVPATSPVLSLGKASAAMLYASSPDTQHKAVDGLRQALQHVESGSAYVSWVHSCHDNLVALLRDKGADDMTRQAQEQLDTWLAAHPRDAECVTWQELHSSPEPLPEFKRSFFQMENTMETVHRGLRNLKANLKKAGK